METRNGKSYLAAPHLAGQRAASLEICRVQTGSHGNLNKPKDCSTQICVHVYTHIYTYMQTLVYMQNK